MSLPLNCKVLSVPLDWVVMTSAWRDIKSAIPYKTARTTLMNLSAVRRLIIIMLKGIHLITSNKTKYQMTDFPSCGEDEFSCLKGRCIPLTWKCNGKPDCPTGEDEVACSVSCPTGHFLCSEGRCIPDTRICDGTPDCGQGEDEVR